MIKLSKKDMLPNIWTIMKIERTHNNFWKPEVNIEMIIDLSVMVKGLM